MGHTAIRPLRNAGWSALSKIIMFLEQRIKNAVAITEDDKVLMVNQYRHSVSEIVSLEIPEWVIDAGETLNKPCAANWLRKPVTSLMILNCCVPSLCAKPSICQ